jgi:Flp pilus assembly protein TadG
MTRINCPRKRRSSGHSVIEVALMAPWIFFLFVGVLDFGFYAYALISTQNAARVAALHNSVSKEAASDPDGSGCQIAIAELQWASYGRTLNCAGSPLNVSSKLVAGADGNDAAQVTVTYQTIGMIPIPGVFTSQLTINRTAQARVNPRTDN